MNRRSVLLGLWLMLALGCGVIVVGMWVAWRRPQVVRVIGSPHGRYEARILGQRNWVYPIVDGVDVWVEIGEDGQGVIARRRIDTRDRWDDVARRFRTIEWRDDTLVVWRDDGSGTQSIFARLVVPVR